MCFVLITLLLFVILISGATAAPTVTTDKADYYSSEIVAVTGSGFVPNANYDVPVTRPDGSIVKGNGSLIWMQIKHPIRKRAFQNLIVLSLR